MKTEGSDKYVSTVPYLLQYPLSLFFGPWMNGGVNVAFAAASKEVKEHRGKYKGAYLTPVARITQPSKPARDERLAKELYQTSLDIMKELTV